MYLCEFQENSVNDIFNDEYIRNKYLKTIQDDFHNNIFYKKMYWYRKRRNYYDLCVTKTKFIGNIDQSFGCLLNENKIKEY